MVDADSIRRVVGVDGDSPRRGVEVADGVVNRTVGSVRGRSKILGLERIVRDEPESLAGETIRMDGGEKFAVDIAGRSPLRNTGPPLDPITGGFIAGSSAFFLSLSGGDFGVGVAFGVGIGVGVSLGIGVGSGVVFFSNIGKGFDGSFGKSNFFGGSVVFGRSIVFGCVFGSVVGIGIFSRFFGSIGVFGVTVGDLFVSVIFGNGSFGCKGVFGVVTIGVPVLGFPGVGLPVLGVPVFGSVFAPVLGRPLVDGKTRF